MQPSLAALFSGGPALRLIDLAISVQESGGKLSLDDEIRRYIRVVGSNSTANWNCSVYASAAVLDFASESIAASDSLGTHPPEFQEKVVRAAGSMEPAEYLHLLAEMVRILDREPPPEYEELPMAGWEFLQLFPNLFGLDAVLMDEGDLPFAGIVQRFVTNEHPYCFDRAVGLTTEAQRALVLFPGERCLVGHNHWGTRDRMRELIETINDHMQREHA
ncbi:hypothetical protein ABT234_29515 [Streptomyces sp. NPDC001586]|uniref:hypothetical protein n=1 Tax=Streptomyces sp. NPDC001586 TaxID=3154387 RepID=UPI00332D06AB